MKKIGLIAAAVALAAGLAGAAVWQEQERMTRAKPEIEHEYLNHFVGEWEFTQSMRMSPEAAWMEIQGTQSSRMIGNLWLISEWKSDLEGAPMNGVAIVGYDPYKEKFVSSYADTMCPAMARGEGSLERRTLTTKVSGTDPKTGKAIQMRLVEKVQDKDTLTWEMYSIDKDGKEYQCGKGEATRRP